jgi:hypothetical protein
MANEMHTYSFSGVTTLSNGHIHRYSGVTSPAPNVPGHVHFIVGTTTVDDRHKHSYNLQTGQNRQSNAGGHNHSYAAPTLPSDGHVHNMNGFTSTFK